MIQKSMLEYAKRFQIQNKLLLITVCKVINLLANIIIAAYFARLFTKMFYNETVELTSQVVISSFIVLAMKIISNYYSAKLTYYTSHKLKTQIRKQLFSKLLRSTPEQITKLEISKISQLSVEGIENIETYYSRYLPQFFYSLLAPVILFAVLSTINFRISLVLLISVFLIPVAIVAGVKIGKKIFHSYWNKYLNVGKRFVEGVQGIHMLKMYDGDKSYHEQMNKESEDFRKMTMKVLRMQLQSITIMDLVAYGGTAVGIVLSVLFYSNGTLSLYGFICFTLLSIEFFVPMRLLGSYFHVGMNGMSAFQKLEDLLQPEEEHMNVEPVDKEALEGPISFQNVSFSYDRKINVINDCTVTLNKGEFIGIIGESGSGKTTFSYLLQRFLFPVKGNIVVGKTNITDIPMHQLYEKIGSVHSQSHIFEGTILTNLQIGKAELTAEEADDILKFVKLHEFVGQVQKEVKSEGQNLSSGQRQKLVLARMILKDADFLLFDEATANIDKQSEQDIIQILEKLKNQGKSIVFITHHLKNIVNADKILVFHNGCIVERGTHTALYKKKEHYQKLFMQQEHNLNFDRVAGE